MGRSVPGSAVEETGMRGVACTSSVGGPNQRLVDNSSLATKVLLATAWCKGHLVRIGAALVSTLSGLTIAIWHSLESPCSPRQTTQFCFVCPPFIQWNNHCRHGFDEGGMGID